MTKRKKPKNFGSNYDLIDIDQGSAINLKFKKKCRNCKKFVIMPINQMYCDDCKNKTKQ